ncbi:MAG: DUF3109 family protein [Verrucomicrobiales bacterium]
MNYTAYPRLELELGRQVREAEVDHRAFEMRLKVCDLVKCRATCCHDGVFLTGEEVEGISAALDQYDSNLKEFGWVEEPWLQDQEGRAKTKTREVARAELAAEFPDHFPATRCVFLDEEHRCVLQRLASGLGKHPWWWKPISCWLHPLLMKRDSGGRPLLTVARRDGDPTAREGYPGFGSYTPCGLEEQNGEVAWRVLRRELELLGKLGGRDFVTEIGGDKAWDG